MKKDLKVAIVQYDIAWKEKTKNLEKISQLLSGLDEEVDIIVLPETFTTGFVMDDLSLAEVDKGIAWVWMKSLAEKHKALVIGSIIVEEDNSHYNRLYAVDEEGNSRFYNKRHLFSLGSENKNFEAGKEKLIVTYQGWKINLLICYDLRFPVWSRNNDDYDCLIYIANWPQVRSEAWKTLLKARSIENQCYTIGVNRIGKDGNAISHSGDSCIIDPLGNSIASFQNKELVGIDTLSYSHLMETREKLPFLKDRDGFTIEI